MPGTKIGGNTNSILNFFQNKVTLWHIRLSMYILHIILNIHTWKTTFSSNEQYIFALLFSRNTKEIHMDHKNFFTVSKKTSSERLANQKVFSKCVYH